MPQKRTHIEPTWGQNEPIKPVCVETHNPRQPDHFVPTISMTVISGRAQNRTLGVGPPSIPMPRFT